MASNLMNFYQTRQGIWRADGIPVQSTFTNNPSHQGDRSIYVRRYDGHLAQYFLNLSGDWEQWDITALAGGWTITGSPTTQGDRTPGHLGVFARRDDGHLIQFHFDTNSNWSQSDITERAHGGSITGDPTIEGDRSVWVRRDDNHLVQYFYRPDGEWEENDVTALSGGRTIGGDPYPYQSGILVRDSNGHLAGFAMMPDGRWYSSDYTESSIDGHPTIDGKPTYNSAGIFARSRQQLVHFRMIGPDGEWGSHILSTGRSGSIGNNDPIATPDAIYVADSDDHLWQYWPGAGEAWNAVDLTERTLAHQRRVTVAGSATVHQAADGSRSLYIRGDYEAIPTHQEYGRGAVAFSKDGNWRVEMSAWWTWTLVYNSVGTAINCSHRVKGEYEYEAVAGITIDNAFFGVIPPDSRGAKAGLRTQSTKSPGCENSLWAAGASISVDAGPGTGLPDLSTLSGKPVNSVTTLSISSVQGRGIVTLPGGEQVFVGPVSTSIPGP